MCALMIKFHMFNMLMFNGRKKLLYAFASSFGRKHQTSFYTLSHENLYFRRKKMEKKSKDHIKTAYKLIFLLSCSFRCLLHHFRAHKSSKTEHGPKRL